MPPTAPQPAHALESSPPFLSGARSAGEAWEAATKAVAADEGLDGEAEEEEEGPAPLPVPFIARTRPAAVAGRFLRSVVSLGPPGLHTSDRQVGEERSGEGI